MFKKFLSSILTVVFVMSMIPAAYAEQPRAGETLKDFYSSLSFTGMSGGSFGDGVGRGFGGGLTIKGAGAGRETGSSFGGGAGRGDWGSGFNKNYGLTLTGSGANNNFQYNDISSVTNITIANTTNNTFYNPVTNNYNTYNNISYNNTYNTYFIQGGNSNTSTTYDTYITNNATYISYYIIENHTHETYYYEIYYQLPDGRNSYDLEPEDVWGTYFVYNAVNYRSVVEDDGITLGLWHLDGNYLNDAYYQDIVPNFSSSEFVSQNESWNGALICDYKDIPIPGIDNFTIEFRAKPDQQDLTIDLPLSRDVTLDLTGCHVKSQAYWVSYSPLETHNVGSPLISEAWFDAAHTNKIYKGVAKAYPISVPSADKWYSISITKSGNECSVFVDGVKREFDYNVPNPRVYYTWRECVGNAQNYTDVNKDCLYKSLYPYDRSPTETYSDIVVSALDSKKVLSGSGVLDELRLSNKVLYTENYTPRTQPFDTNKVLVVPDASTMTDTTIAVKSSVPVGALRVGGVRPTFPANGDVYVAEEKGIVKNVQQFQLDGWYSIQASLYIDGDWKLLSNYDISNLGLNKPDSGGSGSGDSGGSGSGGGGSGSGSGDSGDTDISDSGLWDKLFGALASAVGAVFKGLLTVLATFAEGFASVVSTLTQLFTSLIGLGGEFSDFTGSFFSWLPPEIVGLLSLSITLGIVMAVIRFFWK